MPDQIVAEKKRAGDKWLPSVLTTGIIAVMMLCAEKLGEQEIIFPEIAAIAVGFLLAPRRAWITSATRILMLISISAWLGLAIVLYVPLPYYGQILLAFALSQIIYLYSGTSFAPLVSAVVLPVLLQTRSILYPVSAMMLTALILLCRRLLEQIGTRPKESYLPLRRSWPDSYLGLAKRVIIVAVLAFAALRIGWTYLIAPPLLVAFTEFSNPEGKARKNPVSSILLITMCALAGSACRMVLTQQLHLPLTLSAIAAVLFLIFFLSTFDLYLPPAGAATLLAMIIPENALLLYPVQIMAGVSVLMACSVVLFRRNKKSVSG